MNRNKNSSARNNAKNGEAKLVPITIRFSPETMEIIEKIAKENNTSKAEIVRFAAAGNLRKYLGTIRFLDEEQGREVRDLIKSLGDTASKMLIELRRIGVNYNQEIRIKQIERKYDDMPHDFDHNLKKIQEINKTKEECKGFSFDKINSLISRFETAAKVVGDELRRILL